MTAEVFQPGAVAFELTLILLINAAAPSYPCRHGDARQRPWLPCMVPGSFAILDLRQLPDRPECCKFDMTSRQQESIRPGYKHLRRAL